MPLLAWPLLEAWDESNISPVRDMDPESVSAAEEPATMEVEEKRSSPSGNTLRMPSSSLTISAM
jgi:hypothetical protein